MNFPDIKLELETDVNDVKPETTQLMYNLLDIEGTHFLGNYLLWEYQNSPVIDLGEPFTQSCIHQAPHNMTKITCSN